MGPSSRFPIKNSSNLRQNTYNSSHSNSASNIDLVIWANPLHPYLLCYCVLCNLPDTPSLFWSKCWFRLSKYGLRLLWLCSGMFRFLPLRTHAYVLSSFIKHWLDYFINANIIFSNIYDRNRGQLCSRGSIYEINKQT